MNKIYSRFLLMMALAFVMALPEAKTQIRITEYLYSGASGEFVEFTNVGNTSIDMTGWSFDDMNRTTGVHNLSAVGVVQPGESVIVTEVNPATFRAAWNLCATIKITGGYTNDNLGRGDEINLYNAAGDLADRLTYNDETLGGPRAQNRSAWVSLAGLGANQPTQWTLSALADGEGSFTSSGGDIGSPGKSTRATVAFNPCTVVNGAPIIIIDVNSTTNFLDGGATISPAGSYVISGVINDPTDPAKLLGVDFTIGDDATPVNSLTVTASSTNASVVPNANISLTGSGASRNVKITPVAVGFANITITVNDGTNSTSFILSYGASAASATPANTRWHTGISDASASIALDDDFYIAADDEQDVLNVYSRSSSGLPVVSYNYSTLLALPDPAKPEVDVEAATRSLSVAGRVYWLGSMSNGKSPFDDKPNRNRLFATSVTGTGAAAIVAVTGFYNNLRNRLVAWGDANGYNFTASAAAGVDSKSPAGFAAEGMAFGPDNTTLYIGLRAPLVPVVNRTKAVIAPIVNFEAWFNNGAPSGNPTFGSPIELNLGGRGIRDLIRLSNGTYIIVAGNPAETITSALYKWTGNVADAPILVNSTAGGVLNMEGVMPVNEANQLSLSKLQVISDGGTDIIYNDGAEAKDLGDNNLKKFRSDELVALDLSMVTANIPPSITFASPADGASFSSGGTITVKATATDADGTVTRVELYVNGVKFAEDNTAPYDFTGTEVPAGNYVLTMKAFDNSGDSTDSDTLHITVTDCTGSGSITAEGFTGIPGNLLVNLSSSIKYPNSPDIVTTLNAFEYGPNFGDNYGGRLRGYICAPATGNYIFYIASDEQSELWLSTDDNPANIRRIAYVESKVNFRSWFTYQSQRSVSIRLVKGARYYIETLHKEGTGNDHLSVGWLLPGNIFEAPIPGSRLSPLQSAQTTTTQSFREALKAVQDKTDNIQGLVVRVTPNPSPNDFTLITRSNSDNPLTVTVTDALGRVIERMTGVAANGTVKVGNRINATGLYFVVVQQGQRTERLKLIKE